MTIERHDAVEDQFSRAVVHGSTVYVAGLVAADFRQDIRGQSAQVFANLEELLQRSGSDKSHLLRVLVYLKDFDDYPAFKAAYADWIDAANLPARATVRGDMRDPRILIEIVATAAVASV